MVKILLMTVMIAALCGMVVCNRRQRKDSKYQIVALVLLVLVIASGGLFMCQTEALSIFGLGSTDHTAYENNRKLSQSQGYVLGEYIAGNFSASSRILLISPDNNSAFNDALFERLSGHGMNRIERVELADKDSESDSEGNLITEYGVSASDPESVNAAINRHKNAKLVIIAEPVELDDIKALDMYNWSNRPKLILLNCPTLNEWAMEQLQKGYFEAIITTDTTKRITGEKLPDDMNQVFDSRYVLIHKGNLEKHKVFFY